MLKNVTLGADPELFIREKTTGKIISSIGIIPGEKGNAYTKGLPKGFGLQIDNILAEFNVPPTKLEDRKGFINNVSFMKNYINNFLKNINPDYEIYCSASEYIEDDQLESMEAKLFGCCPDSNAYTLSENEAPEGANTSLRTTGYHIHVGYDCPTIECSIDIIKYLDMYLGVPSILLDKDDRRRELYGKAGCFRLTPYGVEYRVLSGYFIRTPELTAWVYEKVIKALNAYNNSLPLAPSEVVTEVINNGDTLKAINLINVFNI